MKKEKIILTDIWYRFDTNGSSQLKQEELDKLIKRQYIMGWIFENYDNNYGAYHFIKKSFYVPKNTK